MTISLAFLTPDLVKAAATWIDAMTSMEHEHLSNARRVSPLVFMQAKT
jgi:hypothetical protein